MQPHKKLAAAKKQSAARSAPVPSPRGATGFVAETCRRLPRPRADRMILLPMPRASPSSGGEYDPEVQAVLVEIYRRAGPPHPSVRGAARWADHAVGLHQWEGGSKKPKDSRQGNCNPG